MCLEMLTYLEHVQYHTQSYRAGIRTFKIPKFWPLPPPLFALARFRASPHSPKVLSFWLELPVSPSISILVKFREKKLIMSTSIFGWISIKWTPLVMSALESKNQKSSNVNMKSFICHDFPSLDLLERPKDGKIKKCKVFFVLKSSIKVHYISTLNYWSRSTHYL